MRHDNQVESASIREHEALLVLETYGQEHKNQLGIEIQQLKDFLIETVIGIVPITLIQELNRIILEHNRVILDLDKIAPELNRVIPDNDRNRLKDHLGPIITRIVRARLITPETQEQSSHPTSKTGVMLPEIVKSQVLNVAIRNLNDLILDRIEFNFVIYKNMGQYIRYSNVKKLIIWSKT